MVVCCSRFIGFGFFLIAVRSVMLPFLLISPQKDFCFELLLLPPLGGIPIRSVMMTLGKVAVSCNFPLSSPTLPVLPQPHPAPIPVASFPIRSSLSYNVCTCACVYPQNQRLDKQNKLDATGANAESRHRLLVFSPAQPDKSPAFGM